MKGEHFYSKLLVLLIVGCCSSVLGLTTSKMEDGDFLKIVSVPTGNVLTLSGTDATDGKPAILSPWSGGLNQKFLAVEALVAGDSFLLMPQRQRGNAWQRFIRNGGTSPYRNRHDELPDWTAVLEGNTNTGAVTQDARDGKLYQQWRAVKVETANGNKYLLKNRQNNQCLQAPGQAPAQVGSATSTTTTTQSPPTTPTTQRSFFGNIWSSIRSAFRSGDSSSSSTTQTNTAQQSVSTTTSTINVILAPCEVSDSRQHWQLEALAYEY